MLGNILNLLSCLDDVDTTLVAILLEVALAATAAQNLSLHDILHLALLCELSSNQQCLLSALSDPTEGDGDTIVMQQLTCLVLVELQSTERQVLVEDKCAISGLLPHA